MYDLLKLNGMVDLMLLELQGFGIKPHEVVQNYFASDHPHFIDDQELNPIAYAEQFSDPDLATQSPEELLRRARLILATELGKDPLIRQEVRDLQEPVPRRLFVQVVQEQRWTKLPPLQDQLPVCVG